MIGGLMNRTSGLALVAAAGLLVGGWHIPAKAADLGGDCCSDLEERVAELEATTVRKGNRKVSLELSGQVDKALMTWNDGLDSKTYIVDNYQTTSRFRLKGTAGLMPGWKAGYYIEFEIDDSYSVATNQFDSTGQNSRGGAGVTGAPIRTALRERQNNAWIESEKFGRLTIGMQSPAAKDITNIQLGGSIGTDPDNDFLQGFFVRDKTMLGNATSQPGASTNNKAFLSHSSALTTVNFFNNMDSTRIEAIRYDTPSIFGFIFSTAVGNDNFWDVALRYQKEWNSIRFAAGIGYTWAGGIVTDNAQTTGDGAGRGAEGLASNSTTTGYGQAWVTCGQTFNAGGNQELGKCGATKVEVISGSLSVMHVPTGLYFTGAAGTRHIINQPSTELLGAPNKDAEFYYGQLGITKRFFEPGSSTFYVDYGWYSNYAVGANYGSSGAGTGIAGTDVNIVTSDSVNRYGVGFVQAFDSAALQLYTKFEHYDFSVRTQGATVTSGAGALTGVTTSRAPISEDVVVSGVRIQF